MKLINRLVKKYEKISSAVKAGLWFTICNVLQRGIQFIATPLYTRMLSPEDYGMYSIFISWLNIIMVFASLNLTGGVFYNGLIKYGEDKSRFTSSVQMLGTVATVLSFIFYSAFYPFIKDFIGLSYYLSVLMFLVILVNPAFQFWSVQERIQFRYRSLVTITMINSLLVPVIGLVLVIYFNLRYLGVIWGYVIGNVLVSGFFYFKNFLDGRVLYIKEYWDFSLRFSVPLIPHYLSQILLGQFGKIMVNYYLGTAFAGIYTLAYQISLIMNLLITGINNALVPWMYRSLKDRKYDEIKTSTLKLILMVAMCTCALMGITPEIILVFGTGEYLQAKWIIPPIMFSSCVTFVYCIYGTVLFFFEETKKIAFATTSGAIANIIINLLMIPKYGLIAAGYSMVIGYIIMYYFYYHYAYIVCVSKGLSINKIFNIKLISITLLVLFATSLIVTYSFTLNCYIRYFLLMVLTVLIGIKLKDIRSLMLN